MRKSVFLSCVFSLITYSIHAKSIDLDAAVREGLISLSAEGEGGHTGKCLKLSLSNLQNKDLEIIIPAGLVFISGIEREQDLMIIEEKILAIEGNSNRITKMYAACIEAPYGSPSLGSKFDISTVATGHLLHVAQYLSEKKLYKSEAAQYAVWAVSNDKRVENIDHGSMANYVADLLGKPRPEYVILHKTTSSPGEPAYREAPSLIKGRWKFNVEEEKIMTFGLYTKEGELKHAFFSKIKQSKGLHKFSFSCKVFNMPQGKYWIRMMEGDTIIEEKELEF